MALGDHFKAVIYSTIGTTLSAGVIAVFLWLKGLQLHWALLVTAGVVLALAMAAYLVSLIIVQFRKPKAESGADKEPVTNQHEECERTITNLQTENRVLENRDQMWATQLAARTADVDNAQTRYDETKWLRDIAKDQAQRIQAFIHVTGCGYNKHELLRNEDRYWEFGLHLDNRSVYDVCLFGLSGSISLPSRELVGELKWVPPMRVLTQGNVGSFTFQQKLTRDDVISVLNMDPLEILKFSGLEVTVKGVGQFESVVASQRLQTGHLLLTNSELLKAYPKLDIQINTAVYDWIISLGTKAQFNLSNPCYVTLFLDITNRRHPAIKVETFKLIVSVKGTDHLAFADSGNQVHPHRYITDEGSEAVGHQSIPNLNHAIPLVCRQDMPISGALQFVFKGLDFGHFLDDLDALDGAQFTLLIIDEDGERHPQNGVLAGRDKAASLFNGG